MPDHSLMYDLATNLASGFVGATVGACLTVWLTARQEKTKKTSELAFSVYMRLNDLHSMYFRVTTVEAQRESLEPEAATQIRRLSWSIIEDLRRLEDLRIAGDILRVLLLKDDSQFPNATARYDAIGALTDQLGKKLNPRYQAIVREITQQNLRDLGQPRSKTGARSMNAPGGLGLWR